MYHTFRDRAGFYLIYIREAHPTNGWGLEANRRDGVEYEQPETAAARLELAGACMTGLNLTIPALLDSMENTADIAYNGWPERLYVLDSDGRVAYQGGKGPYGFNPDELERFLTGSLK